MRVTFRLAEAMKTAGLNLSQLSRAAGVPLGVVRHIARNETQRISLETLGKLAAALQVEPTELIGREE